MDRGEEDTIPSDSDPLLERKDEAAPITQLSPPQPATVSTLEIEDEEADGSSAGCCRICLEAESEIGDDIMYWRYYFVVPVMILCIGDTFLLCQLDCF